MAELCRGRKKMTELAQSVAGPYSAVVMNVVMYVQRLAVSRPGLEEAEAEETIDAVEQLLDTARRLIGYGGAQLLPALVVGILGTVTLIPTLTAVSLNLGALSRPCVLHISPWGGVCRPGMCSCC